MTYRIGRGDQELFDARIDVEGGSVILHSRGGSTGGRPPRNTQYADALQTICVRAVGQPGRLRRVMIDSRPARSLPEAKRVLLAQPEIASLTNEELARTIQYRLYRFGQAAGVKGGNATKQVRLDFDLPTQSIIKALRLQKWDDDSGQLPAGQTIQRLSANVQRSVTTMQIRRAVDKLLSGEDAPLFAPSRDYDVVVDGGYRLAPKKVFALALEAALGITITPRHFSAGIGEPCFDLLQAAGYKIVDKVEGASDKPAKTLQQPSIPIDDEEHGWAEGSPRIVQHLRTERRRDPRASAEKRNQMRAAHDGRLACENGDCSTDWYSIFPETIAEAVFEIHHTTAVAEMASDHITVIGDLRCLCAACHRAEHRRIALLPNK